MNPPTDSQEATVNGLRQSGKMLRKIQSRMAINQDRARNWIRLAREQGLNDTEIRAELGMSMDEYRQLRGIA